MNILNKFIKRAQEDGKVYRDAFLYMQPKKEEHKDRFAQCSECVMWILDINRCTIHGDIEITGDMSCALFVEGDAVTSEDHPPMGLVAPDESGLVDEPVRCENCKYFNGPNVCMLFQQLNQKLPDVFDLDVNVEAKGCCNGFVGK